MNHLPAEVINLMVKLVPTSYAVISRLNRWFHGCVIGDIEQIKTLSLRRIVDCYAKYTILPNGAKHGKYCEYRSDGSLLHTCDYVDGKRHSAFAYYRISGRLALYINYFNDCKID